MLKKITYKERNKVNQTRIAIDEEELISVKSIIQNVITKKDEAVINYTKQFDNAWIPDYKVSEEEIEDAYNKQDPILISDLETAFNNILRFHKLQLPEGYKYALEKDSIVGQIISPIERVGIYVPGGTAAYPSTVLMNAAPAIAAGVKEIVMITPPMPDGTVNETILTAAKIAGVTEIYKVGGAQGIAALAYGTKIIKPVSKIVGPGNIYVALAKKEVFGKVGIDMIAGPSEILIYAKDDANPAFVAADLLSQAEHDKLARPLLIAKSEAFIKKVDLELIKQLQNLKRNEIATSALLNNGFAILVSSDKEAVNVINEVAPEHLELLVDNALDLILDIKNAGAIFVGEFSPEPLGDYIAGPNHTLPTSGSAKFSSPLSTEDFLKKTSYINFSKEGLEKYQKSIRNIAEKEGLTAHANAIKVRFD